MKCPIGRQATEEHDECEEAVACGVSISNWLERFEQWPDCQDVMTNLMLRWHPALYDEMAWKPPGKDIYGRHFP